MDNFPVKFLVGARSGEQIDDNHVSDTVRHITSDERNTWNNKSDIHEHPYDPAGAANNVQINLDTHADDSIIHITSEERDKWNDMIGSKVIRVAHPDQFGTETIFKINNTTDVLILASAIAQTSDANCRFVLSIRSDNTAARSLRTVFGGNKTSSGIGNGYSPVFIQSMEQQLSPGTYWVKMDIYNEDGTSVMNTAMNALRKSVSFTILDCGLLERYDDEQTDGGSLLNDLDAALPNGSVILSREIRYMIKSLDFIVSGNSYKSGDMVYGLMQRTVEKAITPIIERQSQNIIDYVNSLSDTDYINFINNNRGGGSPLGGLMHANMKFEMLSLGGTFYVYVRSRRGELMSYAIADSSKGDPSQLHSNSLLFEVPTPATKPSLQKGYEYESMILYWYFLADNLRRSYYAQTNVVVSGSAIVGSYDYDLAAPYRSSSPDACSFRNIDYGKIYPVDVVVAWKAAE